MEARKVVEGVQAINGGQINVGTLRLTDFHLVFCAPAPGPSDDLRPRTREKWIPYPMIASCFLRPSRQSTRQPPAIRLRCRDFTFVTFNIPDLDVARDTFEFIKSRTCTLGTVEKLYAFNHRPLKNEKEIDGWNIYDPKAEFRRLGISEKLPDKGWRITTINNDYSFCDTYPAFLVVPSKISDNVLKYAREFRSRNRIPALSYIHPVNNCTITRCSQPLSGITRKTSVQDEKLVAACFSASFTANRSQDSTPATSQHEVVVDEGPNLQMADAADPENFGEESMVMYDETTGERLIYGAQQTNLIVDARPTINAIMNQVQGMGTENMDKYPSATKRHLNIGNIHVMRSSLNKVVDALKDADLSPLPPNRELLQQSSWLAHIKNVLDGASLVAERIGIQHSHVLIHCSDGWDRTSQLSALAQIMLDPFYRTMEGFIAVIEKDWLSFGHMFRLRCGHLNSEDWFAVQRDPYAGSKVQPGDNEDRNDALQNMISGAKRFFNNPASKDEGDLEAISELASGKVVNEEATTPKMVSPVFHQFLDCVYQLVRQNPTRFEFNERFLRRLLYHLYSCQYGTFLYNSEKQRKDARVAERTSSVWDYFLSRKAEFLNPDYDPVIDDHVKGKERLMLPDIQNIRWWYQVFGRTDDEMNGALDAAAAAATDREAAILSLRGDGAASQSSTPQPPSLTSSQSVGTGVESAHETLTPADRMDSGTNTTASPPLRHSVSAEGVGAFTSIRDGIAGLSIGRGVLGSFGRADPQSPRSSAAGGPPLGDQELREMT